MLMREGFEELVRLASIRTREDAAAAYSERFGGFPKYLLLGAPEATVVAEVRHALRTGRPIEAEAGAAY